MQSTPQLLSQLNTVLTSELTSINQYFLHARMFKNWGYAALNSSEYKKSIKDMKQADELIERILFLEGLPNLQALGKLYIGEDPEEMLACDVKFQQAHITLLIDSIEVCETVQDFVSRDILTKQLVDEEEYLDYLLTQQQQIVDMGLARYLQSQL
ncbi:MAG: bacterioferritin [Glaciecola sp.]|jgi:bacterioferritin|uniref:bacterioferritin n=1 Tax=Glaciecola sp. HTCC2999 TaxID=455436 RepID=UPI0000E0FF04|nr:bacterioferritin [Glaciecola sp. HTCC2999]